MQLPSFCVRSKFWFRWKQGSLSRLSAPPVYLLADITLLPCIHFDAYWTIVHHGSPETLCHGASQTLSVNGKARNGRSIVHISPAQTCAPLSRRASFTNPSSKTKLLGIQKWWQWSIKPSRPECGDLGHHTGCIPWTCSVAVLHLGSQCGLSTFWLRELKEVSWCSGASVFLLVK